MPSRVPHCVTYLYWAFHPTSYAAACVPFAAHASGDNATHYTYIAVYTDHYTCYACLFLRHAVRDRIRRSLPLIRACNSALLLHISSAPLAFPTTSTTQTRRCCLSFQRPAFCMFFVLPKHQCSGRVVERHSQRAPFYSPYLCLVHLPSSHGQPVSLRSLPVPNARRAPTPIPPTTTRCYGATRRRARRPLPCGSTPLSWAAPDEREQAGAWALERFATWALSRNDKHHLHAAHCFIPIVRMRGVARAPPAHHILSRAPPATYPPALTSDMRRTSSGPGVGPHLPPNAALFCVRHCLTYSAARRIWGIVRHVAASTWLRPPS